MQDTQLQVKVPVSLQPIFMITHAITPDSPLFGKTEDDINKVGLPQGESIRHVHRRVLLKACAIAAKVLLPHLVSLLADNASQIFYHLNGALTEASPDVISVACRFTFIASASKSAQAYTQCLSLHTLIAGMWLLCANSVGELVCFS